MQQANLPGSVLGSPESAGEHFGIHGGARSGFGNFRNPPLRELGPDLNRRFWIGGSTPGLPRLSGGTGRVSDETKPSESPKRDPMNARSALWESTAAPEPAPGGGPKVPSKHAQGYSCSSQCGLSTHIEKPTSFVPKAASGISGIPLSRFWTARVPNLNPPT